MLAGFGEERGREDGEREAATVVFLVSGGVRACTGVGAGGEVT
jgi:hypothetical protein